MILAYPSGKTYEEVAEQNSNSDLANSRDVDGGLLFHIRVEIALARKVDADSAILQQVRWHLVLLTGHAADDHVALGQTVLELPARLLHDIVLLLPDALTTCEFLHVGNVHAVYRRTVVGQQSCQRTTHDLTPVDHSDGASVQSVAVRENRVVDTEVLKDLDDGERCAGQDALLGTGGVEEANVLVHVEDVLVGQALDVLIGGDNLLQVLVLPVAEDGVVDHNAIDFGIVVGVDQSVFELLAVNFTQLVGEATVMHKYRVLTPSEY